MKYEYGDAVIVTRGPYKGRRVCRVYSRTMRDWCGASIGWRRVVGVLLPNGCGVRVMNADARPAKSDTLRKKTAWILKQRRT